MRAAGTYQPRSSGRPVARDVLDFTGDIGGTIALFGLAGLRRGLGAINCNPFPFTGGQGLVDPTCWCLTAGQTICDGVAGKGTYAAAVTLNNGDFPAPSPPPAVPAVDPNTAPPSSAAEANATINSVIAQQWDTWKSQNSAFFTGVANAAAGMTDNGSLSPLAIGALVIVGIAAVSFLGTRRSR